MTGQRLEAQDVHRILGERWGDVLLTLGVDESYLKNRHGPCPVCGGKDRFRYDQKHMRGDWFCNSCGAGDGFKLLQNIHGWSFRETLAAVKGAAGLTDVTVDITARIEPPKAHTEPAQMTARVRDILRARTRPEMVEDCVAYLKSRHLWPLPKLRFDLAAHVGLDCYRRGETGKAFVQEGRYQALVAVISDVEGKPVTAHVTYLDGGLKANVESPRKILSPVTGRIGCAVRLMELDGDTLGIAEGIETALAAWKLHQSEPVWASLNTSLLARFVPPPEIHHVVVYADSDAAGLKAAWALRDELEGRCTVELRAPKEGDWADELVKAS